MRPAIVDIEKAVCDRFKLSKEVLRGDGRAKRIARPRQIAMYLTRDMMGSPWSVIGSYFGRDHSTAINARDQIKDMMAVRPLISKYVEECRAAAMQNAEARKARLKAVCARAAAGEMVLAPGAPSWESFHAPVTANGDDVVETAAA